MELLKSVEAGQQVKLALSIKKEGTDGVQIYSIPFSIFLGFQYIIPTLIALLHAPMKIFPWFSLLPDDPARGELTSKIFFLSGISCIIQSLFGVRYPLMIAPSVIFISSAIENFKENYWENYSEGDLFAMGPALRAADFLMRSTELQGVLIVGSLGLSSVFGLLWFIKVNLSPVTRSATIISACLVNILQVSQERNKISDKTPLCLLSFGLLLLFFLIQEIKVPFLKVVANEDCRIKIQIFKIFGVFMSFLFCLTINFIYELDIDSYIKRTTEQHSWLSYNFLPLDFDDPVMSLRSWLLFPTFLGQILTSYCIFGLVNKNKGRQLIAITCECATNILAPLFGLPLLLSVEPASLGFWCLSKTKNNESTVISGSLLLVISAFLQVLTICSYAPFSLIFGMNLYLYGQIISKVLTEGIPQEDLKTVIISVLSGMMIPMLVPASNKDIYSVVLLHFLKSPVILTFFSSLLFVIPDRTSAQKKL